MSYNPKLVHLPGTKLTPDVVLHRTVNKLEHIKGIAVVIQWDDDTMSVDWSSMRTSELCMAAMVLDEKARGTAIPLPDNEWSSTS